VETYPGPESMSAMQVGSLVIASFIVIQMAHNIMRLAKRLLIYAASCWLCLRSFQLWANEFVSLHVDILNVLYNNLPPQKEVQAYLNIFSSTVKGSTPQSTSTLSFSALYPNSSTPVYFCFSFFFFFFREKRSTHSSIHSFPLSACQDSLDRCQMAF
jgi:hypothetical protein